MSLASTLRLARLEWRHGSSKSAIGMTLAGILGVALTHLVIPAMPEHAIELLRVGFLLDDLRSVLLINDLFAVYFTTFFLGISGALGVVLLARQEHRLELLLVKPIRTDEFITARAIPVLLRTLVTGVLVSLAMGPFIALTTPEGSVSALEAIGAGVSLTAIALVLVAAFLPLFVKLRDPFDAILIASGIWLLTVVPLIVLLYQPQTFEGHSALRESLVLATLIWNAPTFAWLGWLMLALAIPLSLVLARISGVLLARGDAA